MNLPAIRRSTGTRLQIPKSPGRARVDAAVYALQQALNQMFNEESEKEAERQRARQEGAAKTERRVRLAQARLAARAQWVEVPAKFFWSFANESLDSMRDLAREARKQGQRREADALNARIDAACTELERIQQRQVGGAK
jgi:hypothetical protein